MNDIDKYIEFGNTIMTMMILGEPDKVEWTSEHATLYQECTEGTRNVRFDSNLKLTCRLL